MKYARYCALFLSMMIIISLQACGGDGGNETTGTVEVSLTDAPGEFEGVFVTIKAIGFHRSDAADPRTGDWLKHTLATPVKVDLLNLSNGNMQTLWSSIPLPAGTYRQIRLFLEPTFVTASPAGPYRNYVVIGGNDHPLHIPAVDHGIKLAGTFVVMTGNRLRLAIDFDAGHDIVEFREGSDYVLKPRLSCYDLDHAGAIIGKLATGPTFTNSGLVIKAERLATAQEILDSGGTSTYHVVRRWTIPRSDGSFVLYPVSTRVTSTWDVVIRGLDTKTVIVRGVPITKGSTPSNGAADLGTISTSPASANDYPVAGTIQSPTGAWVQFYQTLQGAGEYPYEIRFRHFNPLWGGFRQHFLLNNDQVQVGTFVSSGVVSALTETTPAEGVGGYLAVAGAVLFKPSTPLPVSSSTGTVQFANLTVKSPYQENSVSGSVVMTSPAKMNGTMDNGLLFAVHGGMIVNSINIGTTAIGSLAPGGQIVSGGAYSISSLPGGFPGAFYGIDAVGWSNSLLYGAIAFPQLVDLRTGNDSADMNMLPLW
jgi:hypothetical protein